jgi:hypothetical protein
MVALRATIGKCLCGSGFLSAFSLRDFSLFAEKLFLLGMKNWLFWSFLGIFSQVIAGHCQVSRRCVLWYVYRGVACIYRV